MERLPATRQIFPVDDGLTEYIDLGVISYAKAYEIQVASHARVVAARQPMDAPFSPAQRAGVVYFLEHVPAVVTVSRRIDARRNLLRTPEQLAALGVECVETDRGGDVTWHGPGQIVVYLILDLNRLGLRVNGYLRMLEGAVIETLAHFGVHGERDPGATGVWVGNQKICAMGVKLARWVSMHGIALNVNPNLSQFDLIVPCGLLGRGVTSVDRESPSVAPDLPEVREVLAFRLQQAILSAAASAQALHATQ